MQDSSSVLVWLDDAKADDAYLVGTKGAFLADLARFNFPFPPTFIITSDAYREFLRYNNLDIKIKHLLNVINYDDQKSIKEITAHIKNHILAGQMPKILAQKILKAYRQFGGILNNGVVDLEVSYLDKHSTGKNLKNIRGESVLLEKIKLTWSNFLPNKYPSVIVSKVLDDARSGIMLTVDPQIQDKTRKEAEIVNRSNLKHRLSDSEIKELKLLGKRLEKHLYFPQEIHWSIYKNKIYFTKIRPMIFIKNANKKVSRSPLLKGFSFGRGTATGHVKKVITKKDAYGLKNSDIAVASSINKEMLPFLIKTKGLIVDELIDKNQAYGYFKLSSIPVLTDTKIATKALKDGVAVTINCALGEVYRGGVM